MVSNTEWFLSPGREIWLDEIFPSNESRIPGAVEIPLSSVRYIIDRFETTSAIVPISRSLSAFVIKALARDIIALLLYSYVLYVFVYVYIRAGVVFAELTFLVANSDAISEAR